MSCTTLRKKIALHAGLDLDGREAAEVSAHLKACLSCYREYVEMRELLGRVRSVGRLEPETGSDASRTEALVAGVMSAIHGPPPPAPQLLARVTLVSGWAAALLVAVTFGWSTIAGRPEAPRPTSPAKVIDHGADPLGGSSALTIDAELGRQLEELGLRRGMLRARSVSEPANAPLKKDF